MSLFPFPVPIRDLHEEEIEKDLVMKSKQSTVLPDIGCILLLCAVLAGFATFQAQGAANDALLLNENFDQPSFGKLVHINIGEWETRHGVLIGREKAEDKHGAAIFFNHIARNVVYEFRFRAIDGCRNFGFGLDPGEDAAFRGHLINAAVTPERFTIAKGAHKYPDREDPRTTLLDQQTWFDMRQWQVARLIVSGDQVTFSVGEVTVKTRHPSLAASKARFIFRCKNEGFQVDYLTARTWVEQEEARE
jgi:hypothetical protein